MVCAGSVLVLLPGAFVVPGGTLNILPGGTVLVLLLGGSAFVGFPVGTLITPPNGGVPVLLLGGGSAFPTGFGSRLVVFTTCRATCT
jgi:hypothetical protein